MKKAIFLFVALLVIQLVQAQLTTASNGLTATGSNAALGGTLSQHTSIDLGSAFNFGITKSINSYLSILNNGNIGIGISAPDYTLHLKADAVLSIGEANATWVSNGVNLSTAQLKFRYNDGGGSWSVGIRPSGYAIETFDGNSGSVTNSGVKTGSISVQTITSHNGWYVGRIYDGHLQLGGESYSGVPLRVKAHTEITPGYYPAMYVDHSIAFDPAGIGGNLYNIHLSPKTGAPAGHATGITFGATDAHEGKGQAGIYVQSSSSYGTKMFFGTTDQFTVGSKMRMVLDNQGNLGIGTATPLAKLDVNGNIFSSGKIVIGTTDAGQYGSYALAVNGNAILNKVKVKLYGNWPDYVFEDNYNLPTLRNVEKFIKRNGHLPGIQSAAEVKNEGVDIGDMQAALLKKIEELTLYIIEINKKIEKLTNENKLLMKKISN